MKLIPQPHDLTHLRATMTGLREALCAERHRWQMECWKVFQSLPRKPLVRANWLLQAAEKAKEFGLYAKATYARDIAYSMVKAFFYAAGPHRGWRYAYQDWTNWRAEQCIDTDYFRAKVRRRLERTA